MNDAKPIYKSSRLNPIEFVEIGYLYEDDEKKKSIKRKKTIMDGDWVGCSTFAPSMPSVSPMPSPSDPSKFLGQSLSETEDRRGEAEGLGHHFLQLDLIRILEVMRSDGEPLGNL